MTFTSNIAEAAFPEHRRARLDLRVEIERAVGAPGSERTVVELLRKHGDAGLRALGAGFDGGVSSSFRKSFAQFAVEQGRPGTLEAVLRSGLAEPEILLDAVRSWRHVSDAADERSHNRLSLVSAALLAKCPHTARVAIEFEAEDPRMHTTGKYQRGVKPRTCHGDVLSHMLNVKGHPEPDFVRGVEMLREFIAAGLPVVVGSNPRAALHMLVCADSSSPELRPHVAALFDAYQAAGMLAHLEAPFTDEAEDHFGKRPLTAAVLNQNWPVATALIRAGADTTVSGDDAGSPGLDAIELAESSLSPVAAEFAAALRSAAMQRALEGIQRVESEAEPEVKPGRRRMAV
jgi:hypothetical protein